MLKFFFVHRYNQTNPMEPEFFLDGLEQEVMFRIVIYAVNAKGRSQASIIEGVYFTDAEKRTGKY